MVKVRVIYRNLPVIVVSLILFQAQCSRSIYDKNPFHEFGGSLQCATMDDSLKDRYRSAYSEGYRIGGTGSSKTVLFCCLNATLSFGGGCIGSSFGIETVEPFNWEVWRHEKMLIGAWIGGIATGAPLVLTNMFYANKPDSLPSGDSLYRKGFMEGYRAGLIKKNKRRMWPMIFSSIAGILPVVGIILLHAAYSGMLN